MLRAKGVRMGKWREKEMGNVESRKKGKGRNKKREKYVKGRKLEGLKERGGEKRNGTAGRTGSGKVSKINIIQKGKHLI